MPIKTMNRWFLLIAEPRVQRILYFIVYACLTLAGINIIVLPPAAFEGVLDNTLVYIFGTFITIGAVMAGAAVLPGVWWLERTGIIALGTGLLIYLVIIVTLGVTVAGFVFFTSIILLFTIRWLDIKGAQLAPKRR